MTDSATAVDGRRLRRQHNRDAAVAALVGLFDEGVYEPSAAQVAERAGLSARSLFRYFDDVDDLTHAAIEQQLAAVRPLLRVDATAHDPLPHRVERFVAARVRLYDAISPAARAARSCAHRNPAVAAQLRRARAFWRRQLEQLFAAEAAGSPGLLAAADVMCSFESYELLRRAHRLSRAAAGAVLRSALTALLGGERQ